MINLLTPEEAIRAILDKKEIQALVRNDWVDVYKYDDIGYLTDRKLRLKPQKVKKYQILFKVRYDNTFHVSQGKYINEQDFYIKNDIHIVFAERIKLSEEEFDDV